jgi:hypothetical protein
MLNIMQCSIKAQESNLCQWSRVRRAWELAAASCPPEFHLALWRGILPWSTISPFGSRISPLGTSISFQPLVPGIYHSWLSKLDLWPGFSFSNVNISGFVAPAESCQNDGRAFACSQ